VVGKDREGRPPSTSGALRRREGQHSRVVIEDQLVG